MLQHHGLAYLGFQLLQNSDRVQIIIRQLNTLCLDKIIEN